MTVKIYSAILEIEGHANGGKKDSDRYFSTLNDIRHSTIENNIIVGLVTQKDEDIPSNCRVKHYGYNYLCENGCQHDLASYGILRYFGITLVIDGENAIIGNTYKPNNYSELSITGLEHPYNGDRLNMKKVK